MIRTDDMDTAEVLDVAREFAIENDVEDVVVASTTGETGLQAVETFGERNVVVVGHSTGFDEPNEQELDDDLVAQIEAGGGEVFVGTMPFRTVNHAIKREDSYASPSYLAADVLRLFGQGTKVALECVLMACDAGLVDANQAVLAVGGTGRGADTVLSIQSANSWNLFESRIRDVVAKPADPENLIYW